MEAGKKRKLTLNGHQERLVKLTNRGRNPGINSGQELIDPFGTNLGADSVKSAESRSHDDGGVVTVKVVVSQKITHFHLDKLEHLRVIDSVNLVDEDDEALNTNLAGKKQVLPGLGPLRVSVRCVNEGDGRKTHICPSEAATTMMAPSMEAAPVIMFLM